MEIIKEYKEILSDNDYSFINRVYADGIGKYEKRLKAIGFENLGHVLDAGCGFGQWSMALANLNQKVSGTDLSSIRLELSKAISNYLKFENTTFRYAPLTDQPFEDNTFDAIFCYGAIFISDPKIVLKEFYRVLKPGGILYTNANGLGWTLNLWLNEPNKASDYNPRVSAAKAFQNTVDYFSGKPKGDGQLIIEKGQLFEMLEFAGFGNILCKGEGEIDLSGQNTKSFFKAEYEGHTGVYEVLAKKRI